MFRVYIELSHWEAEKLVYVSWQANLIPEGNVPPNNGNDITLLILTPQIKLWTEIKGQGGRENLWLAGAWREGRSDERAERMWKHPNLNT